LLSTGWFQEHIPLLLSSDWLQQQI